jgi:protein-S-isoprenylcysteine O-methyltransferase Ste14
MPDLPLLVLALTVTAYWGKVGSMVLRARRHSRDLAGLVPEQRREQLVWIVLVPLVALWIALPWIALNHHGGLLGAPAFAHEAPWSWSRWIAAAGAVASFLFTRRCWKRMGKDWRMDVSEKNKDALITDDLFEHVRHPIYALQILMMVCAAAVLPTPPMLVLAAVHLVLMTTKAQREEAHLLKLHGDSYARYVKRTGRFLPRRRPSAPG